MSLICEFTAAAPDDAATDPAARFVHPSVVVTAFPLPDQPSMTPADLMVELEEISVGASPQEREEFGGELRAVPAWGRVYGHHQSYGEFADPNRLFDG